VSGPHKAHRRRPVTSAGNARHVPFSTSSKPTCSAPPPGKPCGSQRRLAGSGKQPKPNPSHTPQGIAPPACATGCPPTGLPSRPPRQSTRLSVGRGSGCGWPLVYRSRQRCPAPRATATPRTAAGHHRTAPESDGSAPSFLRDTGTSPRSRSAPGAASASSPTLTATAGRSTNRRIKLSPRRPRQVKTDLDTHASNCWRGKFTDRLHLGCETWSI
jgi:hypothetical protein